MASVPCNMAIVFDILTTNYLKSEIALDKLQLSMTFLSEPKSESREGRRRYRNCHVTVVTCLILLPATPNSTSSPILTFLSERVSVNTGGDLLLNNTCVNILGANEHEAY